MIPGSYQHEVALVREEARAAMRGRRPRLYFEELLQSLRLGSWYPELLQLVGTPAGPHKHHQETDSFVHTMMVLDLVTEHTTNDEAGEMARWAALFHDLGKGITPREEWPHHYGHENRGIHLVKRACDRIGLPLAFKDAAVMVCADHMRTHILLKMKPEKWVDLVQRADSTKIKAEGLALVVMADALGRDCLEKRIEGPTALRVIADPIRDETGQPVPPRIKGAQVEQYVRKAKAAAAVRALKDEGPKCPSN